MATKAQVSRRPFISTAWPNVLPGVLPTTPGTSSVARAAALAMDGFRADAVHTRRVRLAPTWRFVVDACSVPRLYFVARGVVRLEQPGKGVVCASAGDTIFLPWGGDHVIATAVRGPALALSSVIGELRADLYRVLDVGPSPPRAQTAAVPAAEVIACLLEPIMVSGSWLDTLPPLLHVRAAHADGVARGSAQIAVLIEELGAVSDGWQGRRAVARRRLAETWVSLAVSAALSDGSEAGWLLIADERLAPVVAAVLNDPAAPWTLAAMAGVSELSRAAFAARFRKAAGEPPHRFVRHVRIRAAATALHSGESVARAASAAGYSDEASLRRAVRQATGKTLREMLTSSRD